MLIYIGDLHFVLPVLNVSTFDDSGATIKIDDVLSEHVYVLPLAVHLNLFFYRQVVEPF